MSAQKTTRLLTRFFCTLLFAIAFIPSASAELEKFVYVFDANGSLLLPDNAANQCPSPLDGSIINACHGVKVAADGNYSVDLPTETISDPDKLVLVAKSYEYIAANSKPGIDKDTYIETKSKRRLEKVTPNKHNRGVNINALSEAGVKAVESFYDIELEGFESTSLAEVATDLDVDTLNAILANNKEANDSETTSNMAELGLKEANLNLLDEDSTDMLIELAALAIEHQDNDKVINTLSKNISQSLINPELSSETTDRIISQVAEITTGSADSAVAMLDADHYVALVDQVVNLSTDNSINAARFFGYTWMGVESDLSSATFSRSEPGSYLVCVTGEIDDGNEGSSDCVRIEVKPVSYAVITVYPMRLPTNDTVHLSAFYSVGAETYLWSSDSGQFSDPAVMETTWTTPAVKGTYDISLTINGDQQETISIEVYDVLPVAIATTDKHEIFIDEEDSTATLTSSSISTDASAVDSIEWTIVEAPKGHQAVLFNSTNSVASFSSTTMGDYTVRLTASKDGVTDSADLHLQVRQHGVPVANAGHDISTFRNKNVRLDGRDSHDLDGLPLTYLWSSNAGNISDSNAALASFTSDVLGEFTAGLTVNNGSHSDSDETTITVRNRLPLVSDDYYDPTLGEVAAGYLHAFDGDGDSLTYTLLTKPLNGGVTIEPSGLFVYLPAGEKGCKFHPDHTPYKNERGGNDVPVIKLCADKFVVSVGETVNLTTSNSINATKHQGFEWIGVESDTTTATFVATEAGIHNICVTGGIGNSKNTSTACVEITVKEGPTTDADNPTTVTEGFVDSFQYLVNDGYGNSNIATVVLKVGWQNTLPVMADVSLTTDEDVPVSSSLSASDFDKQLLIYSVVEQGSLGTLTFDDAATGEFIYTPDNNAFGIDTIKIVAFDGHDYSTPATVTVTINGFNDIPILFNSSLTTLEDTSLMGAQLSAKEPDGEPLTYKLISNGSIGNVELTDPAKGIINYTPNSNVNGHDHFTFQVNDGKDDSNIATVTVIVEAVNDAPTAHDIERIFARKNTAINGTMNAEDIDLDQITYRLIGTGTLGTAVITDANTGAFTFTPDTDVSGSETISYIANDGSADSNIAYIPITIGPNLAPVAADISFTTDNLRPLEENLSAVDQNNDPIVYEIITNASKGTVQLLDIGSGSFRYSPNGELGSDSFTYRAKDDVNSSNTATVNITIVEYNNPPVANDYSFTAFEGVPYTNLLSASDQEESALEFAITNNAQQGSVGINNPSTGEFTYTSYLAHAGSDGFEFSVSDGDKTSTPAKASANIISLDDACRGPIAPGYDADGDGYADIVELAFSTNINNKTQTPFGLNPENYDISFKKDTDEDGFADDVELWLGTDFNDDTSIPTDSLNKAVPSCVSDENDFSAPALLAFNILTPEITITGTENVASFSLTAMDNSSGVKDINVLLRSPSGQEVKAVVNQDEAATMLYLNFDSQAFSHYAEAGIWQVAELELIDAAGNIRVLGTADLIDREFPTEVEVINPNSDVSAAGLLDFIILTPTVDLADEDPKASFTLSASDSPAGIKSISVMLRSPTGTSFRWGEMTDENHANSFNGQIDTNSFDSYAETGTWEVSELAIIDDASNTLRLKTAQLTALGFSTTVEVINGLVDSSLPLLDDFQILTPKLYPAPGDAKSRYSVTASDAQSGVNSIEVMLLSPSGSESMQAVFASPGLPASIESEIETNTFSQIAEAGVWQVSYVVVTDGANNRAVITTEDLTARGFDTTVQVIYLGNGFNTAPVAYGDHIVVDEDASISGQLNAYDADGHDLTYQRVTAPGNGSVMIDASSGEYSYTPNANYFGSDSFSFNVDDGYAESNTATISITVNPVNEAPASEDFEIAVIANTTYTGTIEATDEENDVLTFSIDTNGSLGSASITNANTGEFQYIPNSSTIGNDSFTFTVSDGSVTSGPYTVSVVIKSDLWLVDFNVQTKYLESIGSYEYVTMDMLFSKPAEEIVFVSGEFIGPTGQMIPFAVSTISLNTDPLAITATMPIPTEGLAPGTWVVRSLMAQEIGKTTVLLEEDLVGAGHDATFEVVENSLPTAANADITVQKNMAFYGNLIASDPDGDQLTYTLVTEPSLGTIEVNSSTGAAVYTPTAHTLGEDSFTFKVSDGSSESNIATVNITIIESNGIPVAYNSNIMVFRNLAYGGSLLALDADGDSLNYQLVNNGLLGDVSLDAETGAYVYTPNTDIIGNDSFTFYATDGGVQSAVATVNVKILHEDQVCRFDDATAGRDDDADGYANVIEVAFGSDVYNGASTAEGLNAADLGISFTDDDDSDGFPDYVEIWMGTDPNGSDSKPTDSTLGHLPPCFDSGSDGIKPRLLAFDISTPVVDISSGNGVVSYNMSLIDNASGVRRVRIDLLSPSGAFSTTSTTFDDYPLVRAITLDSSAFSSFAEEGIWQISGITIYDEAGNKRSLNTGELSEAGFPAEVDLRNLNSDNTAPSLDGFSVLTSTVNPVSGNAIVSFYIESSDDIAGLNSVRITLTSPAGVVVEAVETFADTTPTSLSTQIDTATLSSFAEQGTWTITSVLLTDAAGNSSQYAGQLASLGYDNTFSVVTTGGDGTAPSLEGLTVLTPEVFPAGGNASMSFVVSAQDDVSGIEKIRVDLQGPNGQYLAAWAYFLDTTPLWASEQINTAELSDLLQEGVWTITEVEIYDAAGNSSKTNTDALNASGYTSTVTVNY